VFTYILVEVEEPSVLRYTDPCAALSVGTPDPQNTPKFAVDDTFIPDVDAPAAGGAVAVCRLS
jgi:hypothetical protein